MFKENLNGEILFSKKLHMILHGRGFFYFFLLFHSFLPFLGFIWLRGGDGGLFIYPTRADTGFYYFCFPLSYLKADLYTVHQSLLL